MRHKKGEKKSTNNSQGYEKETSQAFLPGLTTIRQPIESIAKKAIEILTKEVEGEFNDLPLETNLPVELLEGTTT